MTDEYYEKLLQELKDARDETRWTVNIFAGLVLIAGMAIGGLITLGVIWLCK